MRIQQQEDDDNQKNFVDYLLQVGEGKITEDSDIGEGFIRLPDNIVLDNKNLDDLISEVFNDINLYYQDSDYIKQRAILSTRNDNVDYINEHILNKLPGSDDDDDNNKKIHHYYSANSVENEKKVDESLYSLEFLNTLIPSEMPPYQLTLKKDIAVILL